MQRSGLEGMGAQSLPIPSDSSAFSGLIYASFGMFVGCYLAGLIPLTLSLSESKTRSMSVFGSGLLIGTALAVILPEGLNMVQNNHSHLDCLHIPHTESKEFHDVPRIQEEVLSKGKEDVPASQNNLFIQRENHDKLPSKTGPKLTHEDMVGRQHEKGEEQEEGDEEAANNRVIGVSLVTGFVFMLFIDHISAGSHSHGPAHSTDPELQHKAETGTNGRSRVKLTTTIGLLVHAAADGIAMAAVSASKKPDLQLLVFVAIMLHKFPASFGLVSFLLNEKTERQRIRKHLMAFSLAAPIGALLTYMFMAIVTVPNQSNGNSAIFSNFSGKAMLFSAGTFLYVATIHILPNIQHSSPGGHLSTAHVLLLLLGSFCPSLLNMFHHHDHGHDHTT